MANRPVEEWARQVVAAALRESVVIHDDGSAPSMYDLQIGPDGDVRYAIEVVGAVDQAATAMWNTGPARGPLQLPVSGDWYITLRSEASIKALKEDLTELLLPLEAAGIVEASAADPYGRQDPALSAALDRLSIDHATCLSPSGTGRIHMGSMPIVSPVDNTGSQVSAWVGEFLREPTKADVLSKLRNSKAPRMEAFIAVELQGAPDAVTLYLTGTIEVAPTTSPDLPGGITGVWVCHTGARQGLYWDGRAWRVISARATSAD